MKCCSTPAGSIALMGTRRVTVGLKQGLAAAFAIARKDLRTEWRTRNPSTPASRSPLVILVLFSFAFDLDREEKLAISGGLLWLVYAFAGALIVNRSFARELPNDCLEVLIASVPGWAIFLGKAIACFLLLLIVELCRCPYSGFFTTSMARVHSSRFCL